MNRETTKVIHPGHPPYWHPIRTFRFWKRVARLRRRIESAKTWEGDYFVRQWLPGEEARLKRYEAQLCCLGRWMVRWL